MTHIFPDCNPRNQTASVTMPSTQTLSSISTEEYTVEPPNLSLNAQTPNSGRAKPVGASAWECAHVEMSRGDWSTLPVVMLGGTAISRALRSSGEAAGAELLAYTWPA
eukprot:CAMPEP_0175484896 /NCGR_PEP_ID=MMETSP0095-20121207/80235_1 /TAXON_ID=311494 /ORGANISM="Alexandrium monilatum, Strain CCMP3105" /LENGTH=107 /DNA_ID=CAMNT_0016786641 /DNA_START=13 /DNA_END=332 /DNA_ORIENTATION=+